MDPRRLALVRGGEDTGFRRVGSGYLIAARLVLTARHVVDACPRIDVRVGHPQDVTHRCAAQVCWTHPDGRDVALLLLDDPVEVPGEVRWGLPAGQAPLPYDALGFPSATTRDGQHSVEHLRGELPVLGGGAGDQDRYVLDQGPAPGGPKAWAGASGSAVFCRDRLVGVVIHDDETFENRRLHACPARSFVADPGFAGLLERHGGGRAQLSQVGTDLERYLRAARLAATEHPYPGVVPGTMPPLAQIYVHRQVVRQPPPDGDTAHDLGLDAEGPSAGSPPRPADEALTGDATCLVIGGPGGGKSSLLRTRLTDGIARWLDDADETGPAPVLVPAAALQGAPLGRALVDTVNAQLRQYGLTTPLPETFFERRPAPGRTWLVLVDGLDEITSPDGRKDVLRTVANAGDDYTFIVATRPVPEADSGNPDPQVPRYRLEPFRPDDLERLATGWLRALGVPEPERSARRFLSGLTVGRLADLVRVPLIMSMLCHLQAKAPDVPLPHAREPIYRSFVGLLHERQYAAGGVEQARAALRRYGSDAEARAEGALQGLQGILAHVAYHLLLPEHGPRPVLDLAQEHGCAERPEAVPEKHWRDFLESVLCGTGLLARRSDDLVFIHQTFVEYFAARHVVDDEERLRAVFRKTLIRTARYLPGRSRPPGVRPRLWFSTYWEAPRDDPFNGFLLDITPGDHPLKNELFGRMASRRAGIDGYRFLIHQGLLGTSLPVDVTDSVVRQIREAARDRSLKPSARTYTARLLTAFDEADGVAAFRELVHDPTLKGSDRMEAAQAFAELAPAEALDVFRALAEDKTLDHHHRRQAMWTVAELDPAADAEPPQDHAFYMKADNQHRAEAALVLSQADHETAVRRLRALAHDESVRSPDRVRAAEGMARIEPAEGVRLLRSFAHDPGLGDHSRVQAAARLCRYEIDAELFTMLARDPTLTAYYRLRAARLLFLLDEHQLARTLLRELRDDTALGRRHRWRAALSLARSRLSGRG
ncbi:trypsin-like peptidase domain-containing protein [Streptomyces sp. NPDC004237]|uniref:trypsin-like peptidase domain-containing protein n=1 Tax=Streptomyces sp. NPDC004237 TaxID=3154455 RepID=UPI0033BD0EEF